MAFISGDSRSMMSPSTRREKSSGLVKTELTEGRLPEEACFSRSEWQMIEARQLLNIPNMLFSWLSTGKQEETSEGVSASRLK